MFAQSVVKTVTALVGIALALGPVYITPLLPDFKKAQDATKVDLSSFGWTNNSVHAGFITLDKTMGRNTYFWFSEALDGNTNAPLLLWLQGGPGASSLFGLFTEIGPFGISDNHTLQPRGVNWNQHYHLLFFDNPVGVGFSYTDQVAGFATNEYQIGEDLYDGLSQFFDAFPHLRKNDFYVTGESYGGKYVPACAYTIHEKNKAASKDRLINLKGISIGDGAFDAPHQLREFGQLLYDLGMVDESEKKVFDEYDKKIIESLSKNDTVSAFEHFDEMMNGDMYPYPTYYANVTGMGSNYFNFELSPDATPLGGAFVEWLNKPAVRDLIHVGDRIYVPDNTTVEKYLKVDWMKGVVDMLVPVMENYKVLIYSGQNDVILGPTQTEKALRELDWTGKEAYAAANKMVWRLHKLGPGSKLRDVAGYVRQVGKFTQAVVRGAGHMVPGDQPERAYDLIERFVSGYPFNEEAESHSVLV